MKAFTLEPRMTTMGGVFYPTGYMVLMFPTERDARHAAALLDAGGVNEESMCLVTPEEFERQIVGETTHDNDDDMPSAGTEGDTERRFTELARQGHHALMVHAPSARETEHVMQLLRDTPISYGQKYRHLIIEDLT